jgi:Metalloenzyme superfamily
MTMKNALILLLTACISSSYAQKKLKTENVILITTDGFRWQEMFGGADSAIVYNKSFTKDSAKVVNKFWAKTPQERREKLLPFFWKTIAREGQLYGNRWTGNKVDVKNPYWFSYPGYNEILTGFADEKINSNDKNQNENITVLEFMNNQAKFKGKVAAYATWDVFPYIINEKRSGVPVNAGIELITDNPTSKEKLLNEMQKNIPLNGSDRYDFLTYYLAKEYINKHKPHLFYLAFDETDELAHEKKYNDYLFAAHSFDKYVADLWNYCQSQPQYKDKTTFVIATDHGRGDKIKSQWTSHGQKVEDCYQIWIAILGPDSPNVGEVKTDGQLYQNQIAKTVAKLLSTDLQNGKPTGEAINSAFK